MPTWPATLPAFVQGDLLESLPDMRATSSIDDGPERSRRRHRNAFATVDASILCTLDQRDIFDGFFRDDVKHGALAFTWVHPRTQLSATFRFRRPPPEYRPISGGAFVRVTMRLLMIS